MFFFLFTAERIYSIGLGSSVVMGDVFGGAGLELILGLVLDGENG